MLAGRDGSDNIVVRGARLLDPSERLDASARRAHRQRRDRRARRAARHERAPGRRRGRPDPRARVHRPARPSPDARAERTRRRSPPAPQPRPQEATARSWRFPNTDPVIDDAERAPRPARPGPRREAHVPGRLHGRTDEGPGRRGADRAGRPRRRRRGRLHRRRTPGRGGRRDAARAAVQRDHGTDDRGALRGAVADARRTRSCRPRGRRARPRRLAVARREPDGRARPRSRRATPASPCT